MKIEFKNSNDTFLKDILNKHLPIVFKRIDLFNLESYKPFFILRNLKKDNGKFRYLLKNVISEPLFLIYAYRTIVNVTDNITGFDLINQITLNEMDIDWFIGLSEKLKKGKFNWSFNHRAYACEKESGQKLLRIGFSGDKIVQKAIYLAFFEIYENKLNYFSDYSHGFRYNRNCHSALHQIKFGWNDINWYIEFDFKKAFNLLKRDKLIELIKVDIQDQALFSLLYKMFKIKIRDKKKIVTCKENVVKGNILSPLLLNIYLTPLDKYSKTLIKTYNVIKKSKRNPEFYRLTSLTTKERLEHSSHETTLKLKQLKRIYKGIPKHMHDASFARVRDCTFGSF